MCECAAVLLSRALLLTSLTGTVAMVAVSVSLMHSSEDDQRRGCVRLRLDVGGVAGGRGGGKSVGACLARALKLRKSKFAAKD